MIAKYLSKELFQVSQKIRIFIVLYCVSQLFREFALLYFCQRKLKDNTCMIFIIHTHMFLCCVNFPGSFLKQIMVKSIQLWLLGRYMLTQS